jgi:hypothetical protein
MTEIQNPKQKTIALPPAHRAYGPEGTGLEFEILACLWHGVWNLVLEICDLFGIWCLEFVILDTKLQGRAIYL